MLAAASAVAIGVAAFAAIVAPTPGPPAFGWQLTGSNTGLAGVGVDRNSLPTFTGRVTAGMTLSRVKITTPLDLTSIPDVTLDRVWLAPSGGVRALILGSGTVITNSDIDGSTMGSGERMGIYGNVSTQYTISRVHMTNVSVGAWLDGNGSGTMSDTYIQARATDDAHVDGFTRRSGTGPLTITRSRLDATGYAITGAFFLQNTWGERIGGITLQDSYLEGGGYALALENKGAGTSVGLNNVRIRATGYGPITASGGITYAQWNNVRVYDATRLPNAEGAAIAAR